MDQFIMKPKIDFTFKEIMADEKAREKAVRDYNQAVFEAEQRGEERGEQQGRERVNRLNASLLHDRRYADMERATADTEYQQQLMDEYGI